MIEKLIAIFSVIALFIVIGTIGYREMSTNQLVVDIQLKKGEDPFKTLKKVVPHNSSILAVRELDRANYKYELVISTHYQKAKLIEIISNNNRVEKAEECQK